ncbi:polysaccharide deacetylase [Steroidobacter agaridevorans]|uniref:Polysaccharide deacetylase n=1 Tax=Steroidobacter agaridevorans TaxID=2695856 RepID=A0A829YIH8_9GAMM|nr:polysaccharide deacetylase [Steroidobacter agaridevorans]
MRARLTLPYIVGAIALSTIATAHDQHPPVQPGVGWTNEEIRDAVSSMRAGRSLLPEAWPAGTKVAVCLTWDMDNESPSLASGVTLPVTLSYGEYGAREGLRRIMELHDRQGVPGTFFVPGAVGLLYPELIKEFNKRPQHEVGIHGWIHENLTALSDRAEEQRLLHKAIDFWTRALSKKPVGYRAPQWAFSPHTLELIRAAGFEYDSSAMSMDAPYEILSFGRPTGLVELPVSWILDDAAYLRLPGAALPSPELVFKVYQDEFDQAYREGTLFVLTMHPMHTGRRANMFYLDRLITYMKSKPGVWFATGREIAEYVKRHDGKFR